MTHNPPLFGSWLDETRDLQVDAYGTDYTQLDPAEPDNLKRLVDYISWNTKSAVHELVELDSETSWKPWQHDDPYVNRDAVVTEAVDVLHFVANVLCAVGCGTDELNEAYSHKMQVNRARQQRGYLVNGDGVKCRGCKRALDDGSIPVSQDAGLCLSCFELGKDTL